MKAPALKNYPNAVNIGGFLAHCWGRNVGAVLVHRALHRGGSERLYQLTHMATGLRIGRVYFRSVGSAVKAARIVSRNLPLRAVKFDGAGNLTPGAASALISARKRWPGIEKRLPHAVRLGA